MYWPQLPKKAAVAHWSLGAGHWLPSELAGNRVFGAFRCVGFPDPTLSASPWGCLCPLAPPQTLSSPELSVMPLRDLPFLETWLTHCFFRRTGEPDAAAGCTPGCCRAAGAPRARPGRRTAEGWVSGPQYGLGRCLPLRSGSPQPGKDSFHVKPKA